MGKLLWLLGILFQATVDMINNSVVDSSERGYNKHTNNNYNDRGDNMGLSRDQAISFVENRCVDILVGSEWRYDHGIQIAAVKKYPELIQYIDSPCIEAQKISVSCDGTLIRYINNPNINIQLAAINQNKDAYKYISNPDPYVTNSLNEK